MHTASAPECQARLRALKHGQALVLCARPERFLDAATSTELHRLLGDEERARLRRFHFERDQQVYRVAHGLTRWALGQALGCAARAVPIAATDKGRPELVGPASSSGLRFNLSHTLGLVGVALLYDADVGFDVEDTRRRADIEGLARSVLSERERQDLFSLPEVQRRARFFELWTLKESYIKAVGHGLGLPIDAISFEFDAAPPVTTARVTFGAGIEDDAQRLRYLCTPLEGRHQLALAVEHKAASQVDMIELGPDFVSAR